MPSLGFLKKKRTRPDDPNSTSQPTSPVTPTSSGARSFDHTSALTSLPAPPVQPVDSQQKVAPASRPSEGEKVAMNPATAHYPSNYAAPHSPSPGTDPNGLAPGVLPSIANLIHPQSDAATHAQQQQLEQQQQQQQQQQQSIPTNQQSLNQQQPQFPAPPANGGGIAPGANTLPQQTSTMPQQQPTPAQTPQAQAQAAARQTKGKYSLADFEILRTLGTGSFGRVHLVQSRHNQRFYAVKVLKKAQVVKMKQVEHTNDERKMLGEVKHPFLITLWGTFQDSRNLYMVMDFVEGGELFSLLRKSGRFPNPVAKFYAAEVTLALEYLHEKNIIYRDLKPENLLLDRHGHLKITDFGFAKRVPDKTWTLCGTPDYLAPEVVSNKGYNKSVDWWSLGILIYEMLCGYTPFWDSGSPMKIYENILRGKVKYPAYINPDAQDLLERLITADLTKRLGNLYGGPKDVKQHAWFAEVTWDRLARKDIDAPYTPPVKAGAGDASQFDRYPEDPERYGTGGHDEYGHLFGDF
ncbi:cAMP-dependent protein kinase catalytic subunit [Gnomoniopsis sp. IMI 355080]|nr:cAMP-dependent protein kinase catalytic subunit [Gnomoniopsis sp. IMI 355080]